MRVLSVLESVAIAIFVVLLYMAYFAAPVLVDVKIYENRESGDMIYCATGSLTDPPNRFVGNGSVPEGDESYC